jgi:acyl-CoA synthetase (AMP-forming)/AMP-acid ligase II
MYTGTRTMGAVLERNSLYHPDVEALIFEDRRLTHRQLHDRASRLASSIHNLGLKRQDRVSVLSANNGEVLEIYFACYVAGFIATPVNFRLAVPEMQYILTDAAPKILFFEAQYTETADALRRQLPDIEHYVRIGGGAGDPLPSWALDFESVLQSGAEAGPPIRSTENDYAHLLYTSGTTGKPKGVVHTHRAVCNYAATGALITDLNGASRVLQATPLFHVGGIIYPYAVWWMGGTTVLLRAFDPLKVLQTIEKERITYTFMVAAMIQGVLSVPGVEKFDVSSMKRIVSAAAPIPVPLLKEAIKLLGPIFSIQYGATEFGNGYNLPVHMVRPDGTADDIRRLASVGHVAPGIGVRLVDDHDNDVKQGETGEVLFKTDGIMAGYWNNHPATIEAVRDGWYHSGDLGYMDKDGFLFLVDRKKDMIISGGENIYSREVEEAVHQHPAVAESAVIGVPDPKWVEAVKVFVVLKPGARLTAEELIEHCRTLIARYKCPRDVEFIAELPRIASGKINKVALRDMEKSKESGKAA